MMPIHRVLRRVALAAFVCTVLALAVVLAGPEGGSTPAAPTLPALERLKSLAGTWIHKTDTETTEITYRVTGAGSAIVETISPGTPHEMVTVYHRDGSDVVLTHYCAAGNQPRMRAKGLDGSRLAFKFDGGANIDPAKDTHMHDMTLTFVDTDHLKADWVLWQGGKQSVVESFDLSRKK